jgi:hypothetical protein
MVEHSAVNRNVGSSNLPRGAKSLFVNHLKLSRAVGLEPKACSYAFVCRLSYLLPPKSNADGISTFLLRFLLCVMRVSCLNRDAGVKEWVSRIQKLLAFHVTHLADRTAWVVQIPEKSPIQLWSVAPLMATAP